MDGPRFDDLARSMATPLTRRRVLAGIAAGTLGLLGRKSAGAVTCRAPGIVCNSNSNCCSLYCGAKDSTGRRRCECPPGTLLCNGKCTTSASDFQSDVSNCGSCGNVCPRTTCQKAVCVAGVCGLAPDVNSVGRSCDDGDGCTVNDVCKADGSCGGTPVVCTAIDACHDAGTCNPATGTCTNPAKANGSICDDGNLCTQSSTCQAGVCTGSNPKVCTAMDQCHDAGVCDPQTGSCSNPRKVDGSSCDDGNACTQTDTCQAGVCVGGNPVSCSASDQCHDAGVCNPITGVCSNPAKSNGVSCIADNNACTVDTCQSGVCTAGTPLDCSTDPEFNDQCNVGICNTLTGLCERHARPNGSSCNDGNACTQTDTCQAGVCVGSNPVVCTALDQCHVAGTCNPATGICSNPPKADGTSCSDNNACTNTDTCQAGICTPGTSVVCPPPDQCHSAGVCNAQTGQCEYTPKANGTSCDDGDLCTTNNTCQSGVCSSGTPVICTASDACHDAGVCNPQTGVCSNPAKANGSTCDDGNLCTTGNTCQDGTCSGGTAVVCTASDQCHDVGVCNPQTGICSNPPKANGTTCDDGNLCTAGNTCQNGTCSGGTAVICTASDQCHVAGVCNPQTGTCSNPEKSNGTSCDDGNLCTTGNTCQSGICSGGTPVICSASDQCHDAGVCNPQTGQCSNPAKTNGTVCDDGSLCTSNNTCQSGVCSAGTSVTCTAQDQCHTAGVCNPQTGICSNPQKSNGTSCDDGNLCTTGNTCQSGTCSSGTPVVCSASDQCHTAGVCDPQTGQCSNPAKSNGTSCDDGNLCTTGDTCQSGTCTAGASVVCSASDQCHNAGVCNPATGQCSNPAKTNGTVCNDGNACTTGNTCQSGICSAGTAVICTAVDQCHGAGTCDSSSGQCSSPELANGTACSGGTCCNGNCCPAGKFCCGNGANAGCCDVPCCGSVCCTFSGAVCCPDHTCRVGPNVTCN